MFDYPLPHSREVPPPDVDRGRLAEWGREVEAIFPNDSEERGYVMFAIGGDELEKKGPLGDMIRCKACGAMHKVEYGDRVLEDGTREKSKMLAFITCTSGAMYLVGLHGKEL